MSQKKQGDYLKQKNLALVERRIKLLQEVLPKIKVSKSDGITSLCDKVSEYIYNNYSERFSSSTLRSNGEYRVIIESRLIGKKLSPSSTQHQLLLKKSEIKKLRDENKLLVNELSKAHSQISALEHHDISLRTSKPKKVDDTPFKIIMKLLTKLGIEGIVIDSEYVYDTVEVFGKQTVVFSKEDYPEFFEWYFTNTK
ncbi:hypothetical protein [Thalassotalea eurytherma]|uniref:Uncharacterized protein n=1 Tax=Thalassotalea eurytherma TaxID=1144278 RepID=A0ABQ6H4R4_9GAMM|nr:hypothetical protein [Thalassotalea eurytherma]GLX81856.1 hypothetical protein theurythT_13080 [Thalassotalea eurytherma]